MKSTAARTIDMLRADGWRAELVERFNQYSKTYKDLFGFADVIAMHPQKGILLIQVTTGSHVNARLDKMRGDVREDVECAILAPFVNVEIHGWRKLHICTQCGKPRYGSHKACECGTIPNTRKQWYPIIMHVGMNELNGEKSD